MERAVRWAKGEIQYELERKRVRNLNLRIRRDGTVFVSANSRVPLYAIDAFVAQKAGFILSAQERLRREAGQLAGQAEPPREECLALFTDSVARMLPLLADYGVKMPVVKTRAMKSRWGSCAWKKGTVTLNTRLWYAPRACLEYVALHELCHFIHPDHSPAFHRLLTQRMPDWKARKAELERWSIEG